MAAAKYNLNKPKAQAAQEEEKKEFEEQEEFKQDQSTVDYVELPHRSIYIREVYEKYRILADDWPISFKPQPPAFLFVPTSFDIPTPIKQQLIASDAASCAEGKVCMAVKQKTFQIVASLEIEDLKPENRCIIDHPVMILAAKSGKFACEQSEGDNQGNDLYYFKDLIIITDVEPCFMCAMALIHSRAQLVIFKNRNEYDGAFVSHPTEIYCLKSLNHSFNLCELVKNE